VALYFVRGNHLGVAHRDVDVTATPATGALRALFGGPNGPEVTAGLSTAVPGGSQLLSVSLQGSTITVDVNSAFAAPGTPGGELARVAQVVYTVTQFPSVQRLALEVNGATPQTFASGAVSVRAPLARTDVLGALPAILVENPAVGDTLRGSVHLTGMANVFEAQFRVQVVDHGGVVLLDQPVHATAGSGTWGTFDATVTLPASASGTLTVKVFDLSARDGSRIDEVDIPVVISA
jgi:hypothetical protein